MKLFGVLDPGPPADAYELKRTSESASDFSKGITSPTNIIKTDTEARIFAIS
jgi:hypothetical protein